METYIEVHIYELTIYIKHQYIKVSNSKFDV